MNSTHTDKNDRTLIGVVNYGAGNLGNVRRALDRLKVRQTLLENPDQLISSNPALLLLPGVGAFKTAFERLAALGWPETLTQWADKGRPLLGICVGMQLLCTQSDEDGLTQGLGLLRGCVTKLSGIAKTPHMGWNNLAWRENVRTFATLADETQNFYFVHSYAAEADSPHCVATTEVDGVRFCSVMKNGPVMGFQFHPERSGPEGVAFLGRTLRYMIESEGSLKKC